MLSLLRHAKSSWDDAVPKDFDRPLNEKGKKAAKIMGQWMAREKLDFGRVIASPAQRVVETIDEIEAGYRQKLKPLWERKLYLASNATLIDVLRESGGDAEHILIVGHNPTLEDVAFDLIRGSENANNSDNKLLRELYLKYPTGTFAQIDLDIEGWDSIEADTGTLTRFVRPRDLDPSLGPDEH